MVSALFYEQRKKTANNGRDLKQSAQAHRNIYHAIRAHDAKRARAAMSEHLSLAQQAQALEGAAERRFQQATASLSLEQAAHRARRGPRLLVAPPVPSSPAR
jgi:GntR family transcriptional repressor for pyruvate dehydrogenase complex